ncbi:MAG: ATP-binding protein [Desulfobacteraceae bacterium]|nr:ATP-binding protein [Desulfobacteraceae bacterium]
MQHPPHPEAYLIPFPAESFAKPLPIGVGQTTIGSDSTNTIQIAHESIAEQHAFIVFKDGHYLLSELDKHNRTFVNGQRIKTANLQHHDKITFGHRTFLFLMKSESLNLSAPKPFFAAHDTIKLHDGDLDPSELLAQRAKDAAKGIFRHLEAALDEDGDSSSQAHQRLSLLYQLSEKLRKTKVLDEVLRNGLELILQAIPGAERALVLLGSNPEADLEISAVKVREAGTDQKSFPISRTIVDWVLTEKMALASQNLAEDARFQDSDSIRIHNLNAIVVVPMLKDDQVLGMLYIDSRDVLNTFSLQDVAFAAAAANELALCIENIRLQNELIQNERMAAIGLTMTNMAHSIKNLLSLNQNAVDLLGVQLQGLKDKQIDKTWSHVLQSFTRINNLAANMLEFARDHELSLQPMFINHIIQSNRRVFEQSLSSKGIALELKLSEANPCWMIDGNQFQRVLVNLAVNAIDAVKNREGAKITITTAVDEHQDLKISVADNGCGIAKDKLGKIFELFYTTKGSRGSGLGLPMVKKYVEKLGGTIEVQSEVDKGSTFTLTLPKSGAAQLGKK